MKKTVIVLCIILAVGFVLAVVGSCIYLSTEKKEMENYEKIEKEIVAEGATSLTVGCQVENVTVTKAEGDKFTFTYYEGERLKHTLDSSDGKVTLLTERKKQFFNFWTKRYEAYRSIIVGIPQNYTGELTITTDTGDVSADGVKGLNAVEITVKTGDAAIKGASAATLKITSSTGDVTIENGEFSSGITVKNSTGSVNITAKADEVEASVTTGKINVNADCDKLSLTATTGNIVFGAENASDIFVKTTTGDIDGEIVGDERDYDIECDTTTGDCNLKNRTGEGGKKLTATATTGDIKIKFS